MSYRLVDRSGPVVPYSDVYDEGGDWIGSVAQENDPPMWVPFNTLGGNLCLGASRRYETLDDAVEALHADYRRDRADLWALQRVLTFGPVEDSDSSGRLIQTVWAPAQGFEGHPFGDLGPARTLEIAMGCPEARPRLFTSSSRTLAQTWGSSASRYRT